ncbi:MAG TPA: hypothetical protein VH853_20900 [Polyangia bacterium]|jgi:hypothetical protein|nr:hypothetical protein [Polyangia bacterium]
MTAALGGALLFSALVGQASGPAVPDAGAAPASASAPMPDAAAGADGPRAPDFPPAPLPAAPLPAAPASAAPAPAPAEQKPADVNKPVGTWLPPHYDEGFVLVSTPDSAPLPYLLKLNHVSQFKYTNTQAVHSTYLTHLGEVKDVNKRNDFQLTRDVFYFSGYVFDKRLDYNIILYTSSADLTAAAAGYVGYVFHKAFALRAGFFSLPSLRAMTGTYPYFAGTDRSMEVNYMRPGFTQGVWATGEPLPGLNYIAMIGNSLNTLNIAASRIDYRFAYAVSLWYDLNDFGKAWNDYERHQSPALRIGSAFTYAREDRLSDLSEANPENNSTYMSDGTLLFGTGTLAPNVTVSLASYYLYAVDAGIKYRGFAFNAEFAFRWLDKFVADGPLPLASMFDWGFEASLGYFALPKRLEPYLRSSLVAGPFATAVEGAAGAHWYPFPTRQVWLSLEVIGIKNCPYTSALYVYSSGQTGVLVPAQFLVRF